MTPSTAIQTPLEPKLQSEWRDAVNIAEAWLLVDDARKYGLITGGPDVDVDRCLKLIDRGRRRGFSHDLGGVDVCLAAITRGYAA